MPVTISTIHNVGLEGRMIQVEVDISAGLPSFTIVGLADAAVLEARERIRSAIKNSGYIFPPTRKTISLAPADIRKHGPAFDLAMAVGLLAASQQVALKNFSGLLLGELSLDGHVRAIPGIIPLLLFAKKSGITQLIIPRENANEASLIDGLDVKVANTLREVVDFMQGKCELQKSNSHAPQAQTQQRLQSLPPLHSPDPFANIIGQERAKRAIAIAAAGHHNIMLSGAPGMGKTLLAHAISQLLPPLTHDEFIEVASIYSIRGISLFDEESIREKRRPVREIHHTSSLTSIIGGTAELLPGEISLAHRGVLVLDEISEFPRGHIESLRQPIEEGAVTIARASGSCTYPSKFLLLATTNPCPCGYLNDPKTKCICTPGAIKLYDRRISGPILDRIDLRVKMEPVDQKAMVQVASSNISTNPAEAINRARHRQQKRFENTTLTTNSDLTIKELFHYCILEDDAQTSLTNAANKMNLSARSIHRLIKLARTIADMDEKEHITIAKVHINEALQYRC